MSSAHDPATLHAFGELQMKIAELSEELKLIDDILAENNIEPPPADCADRVAARVELLRQMWSHLAAEKECVRRSGYGWVYALNTVVDEERMDEARAQQRGAR